MFHEHEQSIVRTRQIDGSFGATRYLLCHAAASVSLTLLVLNVPLPYCCTGTRMNAPTNPSPGRAGRQRWGSFSVAGGVGAVFR